MESILTKKINYHQAGQMTKMEREKITRRKRTLLIILTGVFAVVSYFAFFNMRGSIQITPVRGSGNACLLTGVKKSFEVRYHSSSRNEIRVYDGKGREIRTEYIVDGKEVRIRFTDGLKKGDIYRCTLKKGDWFLGKTGETDLKNICTLYFTRMHIDDRYFQDRKNEVQIAGDNLPDLCEMRQGSIFLGDIRLFLNNEFVSWNRMVRLEEEEYKIYLDGSRVKVASGELKCRRLTEGEHILRIEITEGGERLKLEKSIVIVKDR